MRTLVLTLLAVLFSEASIAKGPYALYQFPTADTGRCMASLKSSPKDVLQRNGIGYRGTPTTAELKSLAKGLEQIERLRGGEALPKNWRTQYNYITSRNQKGKYTWNQGVSAINVRRPKGSSKGENVTRLMHELGHKVGNTGAYGQYRRYVGKYRCQITNYCKHKHNEEFAEAFAAYITMPDKLKTSCPRAFKYFSRKLFPESEGRVASCDGAGEIARRSIAGQSETGDQ